MSIDGQLEQIAVDLARGLRSRSPTLKAELREIRARLTKIEAELETVSLASQRVSKFRPQIGLDHQCPRCWIEHEKRSTLSPMSGNAFRCHTCGLELSLRG